jgi:triosephosphate isomerase
MHLDAHQASLLVHRLHERIRIHNDVEVVLAPSFLHLQPLSLQIDRRKFRLAAQNAYFKDEGAFTGEVSFTMLRDLVRYVIIGHSDRRYKFGESLDDISAKVSACVRNDITPILCVGERKEEKHSGETKRTIHDQIVTAIAGLTAPQVADMIIAYEPVWALSSGSDYKTHAVCSPDDVEKVAVWIRSIITDLYGKKTADQVKIQYGGSTSAENARSYLDKPNINGLLVGGASLNYEEFSGIVEAAYRSLQETKNEEK